MNKWLFILVAGYLFSSCYSFRSSTVSNALKTYYVKTFDLQANLAPPQLAVQFSDALKDRIRTESPLKYSELKPDISYQGTLVEYRVSSEAQQAGEQTAISRLTIRVDVQCTHEQDEKKSWKKSFEYYANYDPNQNLLSIQDELHKQIFTKLLDDVYNQTFGDW